MPKEARQLVGLKYLTVYTRRHNAAPIRVLTAELAPKVRLHRRFQGLLSITAAARKQDLGPIFPTGVTDDQYLQTSLLLSHFGFHKIHRQSTRSY